MDGIFEPSEVLEVLRGYNPWWENGSVSVPPFRRLAYKACRTYLDNPALRRAVLLNGPRRVGKTTILLQTAADLVDEGQDPRSILYVSLDHPLLKLAGLRPILKLYHETIHPESKSVVLLLDEVQYASDWDLELKQLIDRGSLYRILATGSASIQHRQALAESGVGRWITVRIPTLSFYEFLHIRGEAPQGAPPDIRPTDLVDWPIPKKADLGRRFERVLPAFNRYLLVGGFPETALMEDVGLSQRILREDVVERVLKRDMAALFGIRNVADLEKLFVYICLHTGEILSKSACSRNLGVPRSTLANHLESLVSANLVYALPPVAIGGKKVLRARNKVHLIDAALRNAVLLRGQEVLSDPTEMGLIVETAILRHLYAYYHDVPRIGYWRDAKTQQEVDIVVSNPRYTIPVEVKYRRKAELGPKEGIVRYARAEHAKRAFWITRDTRDFNTVRFDNLDTAFLRIPAHIFTYFIGQAEQLLWEGEDRES